MGKDLRVLAKAEAVTAVEAGCVPLEYVQDGLVSPEFLKERPGEFWERDFFSGGYRRIGGAMLGSAAAVAAVGAEVKQALGCRPPVEPAEAKSRHWLQRQAQGVPTMQRSVMEWDAIFDEWRAPGMAGAGVGAVAMAEQGWKYLQPHEPMSTRAIPLPALKAAEEWSKGTVTALLVGQELKCSGGKLVVPELEELRKRVQELEGEKAAAMKRADEADKLASDALRRMGELLKEREAEKAALLEANRERHDACMLARDLEERCDRLSQRLQAATAPAVVEVAPVDPIHRAISVRPARFPR